MCIYISIYIYIYIYMGIYIFFDPITGGPMVCSAAGERAASANAPASELVGLKAECPYSKSTIHAPPVVGKAHNA